MAHPVPATRLVLTPGSVARAVVLVAGWLIVLAIVARARGSLVLFGLGVVGAALTLPLVGYLEPLDPPVARRPAGVAGGRRAVGLIGYRAVDEVDRQTDRVADAIDESVARIETTPRYSDLADRLDLKQRASELTKTLREDVSLDASRLSELAPTLASGASEIFVIWLFAVMMLAAGPPFVAAFVRLFPSPVTQARVRMVIIVAHRRMTRYVGLMLLRAVALFGLTFACRGAARPAGADGARAHGGVPQPLPLLRTVRRRRGVRPRRCAEVARPGRPHRAAGDRDPGPRRDLRAAAHRAALGGGAVAAADRGVADRLGGRGPPRGHHRHGRR